VDPHVYESRVPRQRPEEADDRAVEDRLRQVLAETAGTVEPANWLPVAAVRQRAGRRQRARRLAVALPAVAAVTVAAALMAGAARHTRETVATPGPAPAGRWSVLCATPSGAVARPGEALPMMLQTGGPCADAGDAAGPHCVLHVEQPLPAVDGLVPGTRAGAACVPVYTGPGPVVRTTLTLDGRTSPTSVQLVDGHLGYQAPPGTPHRGDAQAVITVYGPWDEVLGTYTSARPS